MRLAERIEELKREGLLDAAQAEALSSAESGAPFSIGGEIKAFLYVGVLLIAAGAAATVKTYFAEVGPIALTSGLTAGVLACGAYVFRRGAPWSRDASPAPTAVFDYVLFLGCLLLSCDIAYVETTWHLLGGQWPRHLLVTAAVFFPLAYRYDNKLVLSLGLSSLAAWLGLELRGLGLVFWEVHQAYALAFGFFCAAVGTLLSRERLKAHFLDVYLNFAAHFLGAGLLSGTVEHRLLSFHFYALAALCAVGAAYAFRTRKFVYLVYAALYGYAGLTAVVLSRGFFWSTGFYFFYFILSSLALVSFLYWTSRLIKEEA